MLKKVKEQTKEIFSHKAGFIIVYSILWAILAGSILIIFNKNGKSFLFNSDGLYQHFVSFNYLSDYLKDLICNFNFSGFFDFTLGQGMDVLTTLNSYDFTDPISILCACVLPLSRVGRYTLMIFVKLYLVGISFLFYCHAIEQKQGLATVGGAIAYTFCGAVLFMFARHPNYINWAYFLPFILGGIELYFRKQKKTPIILSVFLNLITSYYTFYINAILAVIYVFVQVICKVTKERKLSVLREELVKCIKLLGVCIVGVLLSAFILFPTIYAYLNNNRIGEATGYIESALKYGEEYYKNEFENLFIPYRGEFNTSFIGFNAVLIIPLTLIFTKRKQYTSIKVLFTISLIMLGIPLVGRIMNGFGYASNRWAFVIPFYASIIFVLMFGEIGKMTEKEKTIVLITVVAYVTLCCLHTSTNTNILKSATVVMLVAVTVAVVIALHYKYPSFEPFLFSLVLVGSCFQIYFTFSESEGNYINEYFNETEITSKFKDYSSSVVETSSNDDSFFRIEMEETRTNVNGYNNVYGTGFWWSLVPGDMVDYYTDLSLDSVSLNCYVFSLDGRAGLLELASVKYYTRPAKDEGLVPYGYEEIPSSDKRYQIFENNYALPIGYTYSGYISSSDYDKMNGIEKEQALLQGAVLEEEIAGFNSVDPKFDYETLDFEMSGNEGVNVEEHKIEILNTDGEIDFKVTVPDDYEIYVYISNIELEENKDRLTITAKRDNDACSISKTAAISNMTYNWPVLRDDIAFNLGSGYSGENEILLNFNKEATFTFDDIQIIAVPMSSYIEYAEDLGEYVLDNVVVGNDQISGNITIPEERILQFSVPYSEGWKAFVDGEEVSILKSDIMYMAIPLSAGEHTVELYYETPYLREGIFVTIATSALFALYEIVQHRRKKLKGAQDNE